MNRLQKLVVYAASSGSLSEYVEKKLQQILQEEFSAPVEKKSPNQKKIHTVPTSPKQVSIKPEPSTRKPSLTTSTKPETTAPSSATETTSAVGTMAGKTGFKEKYVAAKNVQERQQLILQYAQKPKQLHPIQKKLPNGSTFTYYVMPEYLMIDGQLASVTPQTAQILAKRWGMILPTGKMVEEIHEEANRVGGVVKPTPLSSTGYFDPVTGKQYTAEEVARMRINAPGANIAYSERLQKEKEKNPNAPIYSGLGKTIIQPLEQDTGQIFFKGIPVKDKSGKTTFIQSGTSGAHGTGARDTHEEYITGMQAASDMAEITRPDGTKEKVSLKEIMKDPELYKLVSDRPGVVEYKTPGETSSQIASTQAPTQTNSTKRTV